jgi:hypothetical protein
MEYGSGTTKSGKGVGANRWARIVMGGCIHGYDPPADFEFSSHDIHAIALIVYY